MIVNMKEKLVPMTGIERLEELKEEYTKKYRILYMINSYTTKYFVKAENEEAAEKKFREVKGNNPKIISIEKEFSK